MTTPLPQVALSIQQPWAWLIVNGIKDVENRKWVSGFRGPVLIHAGKTIDTQAEAMLRAGQHPAYPQAWARRPPLDLKGLTLPREFGYGGIVGVAEMTDCLVWHEGGTNSSWFRGPYGFVLENARPLPFMPMRGQLNFFKASYAQPGAAA